VAPASPPARVECRLMTNPRHDAPRPGAWLLVVALLGLVVPNGFFLYWLFFEFQGFGPVLADRLALGFILDVALTLIVLSVYFARHPLGTIGWPWFVVLSFAGGIGFSLPLYYWLNRRPASRRNEQAAARPEARL